MKNIVAMLLACVLFGCNGWPEKVTGAFMPSIFMPFDLNALNSGTKFDDAGIPLAQIWSQNNQYRYNPTTTAQWGLGSYARYTRDHLPIDLNRAIQAADWLLAQQSANGGFPLMFDHHYPDPRGYQLKAPWYSAVTQGNAISLLVRVYSATGDKKYRDSAIRAVKPFNIPTTSGGLRSSLNDSIWFEETPDPKAPNHIFNGFIFGLLGIGDLYKLTGDPLARNLWNAGQESLLKNLHMFVIHTAPQDTTLPMPWSVYDLQHLYFKPVPNYLTDFYMGVHIALMREMYARSGRLEYKEIAQQWSAALVEYKKNH